MMREAGPRHEAVCDAAGLPVRRQSIRPPLPCLLGNNVNVLWVIEER